jgi:hypothetical protein
MKQGLGAQTKAQRQGGFPDSCKVSQCSLLNGISQGGLFFPLPGQQVSKIHAQLHNSPPPPLSIANPGRIGGGFSQSKWNLSKGALSQYQVNNYPKCMLSMTIHLPHPYRRGTLKELGEVLPNVGKFLVLGRIFGPKSKVFFLNGIPFDFLKNIFKQFKTL